MLFTFVFFSQAVAAGACREVSKEKSLKTEPANSRISLFKNRFKSRFDSRFRIYAKNHADWHRNHWFWCILRRVTAILLEKKNFGPNVWYCVLGHHGGPCADEVDLEVYSSLLWYCHRIYSLFTLQKPQVYLRPTQVDFRSTSSRPRRHRPLSLHITNGTKPLKDLAARLLLLTYIRREGW